MNVGMVYHVYWCSGKLGANRRLLSLPGQSLPLPVALQVDPLAQPGTVTLYLVANRGVVKPIQTEISPML